MLIAQRKLKDVSQHMICRGSTMRKAGPGLLVVWLLLCMPLSVSSQVCPDVDPGSGYPVAATLDTQGTVPSQWLDAVATAAETRWRVPSRRRNAYSGWKRVKHRTLPPEPRWADDWIPTDTPVAILRVVLFRDGRSPLGHVVAGSGEKRFDETLSSIWRDPMPGAPTFPGFPSTYAADSAVVSLYLGKLPDTEIVGVERFAAVQTPVELNRSTLRVSVPGGRSGATPRVTVKYDVTETGTVDGGSIEFLSMASYEFQEAIRSGLMRARFRPPTSNCRPIRQSVVQTFGG